jgi:hypothetical protein
MMTTAGSADVAPGVPAPRGRRVELVDVLSAAVGAAGVALAFLVGRDGSAGWQVVRVGAVVAVATAALLALRRAPALVRGLTCFVVGVAATVAGAGVGLPYLHKVGWSSVTAAGVVALAAGGCLLGSGAAITARHTRRWWRLLVPSAAPRRGRSADRGRRDVDGRRRSDERRVIAFLAETVGVAPATSS